METKELDYNGKKIFCRTVGSGPVVVLLHGFGEDGTIWKDQFGLFPHNQLLVPDLPGSGRSEAVADMSMEGLAEVVKAIVAPPPPKGGLAEHRPPPVEEFAINTASSKSGPRSDASANPPLGGGGAILIGHSMGGYIALAFAEKYPGLLSGFGLFHSTAYADSEEKKETRRKGIRFIEENGARAFLKTATPNLYAPQTREQHPELMEEHLASVHNFSGASLVSYYASMIQRPDRTAVLRNSQVPVLFVLGRYDGAVPLPDGLQQCHLPRTASVHILENAGHMGMREEISETNKILSQFVNATQTIA